MPVRRCNSPTQCPSQLSTNCWQKYGGLDPGRHEICVAFSQGVNNHMLTLLKVESAESLLYEIYEENIEANLTT